MAENKGFIERHGLWTDEQWRLAAELERRLAREKLQEKLLERGVSDPRETPD